MLGYVFPCVLLFHCKIAAKARHRRQAQFWQQLLGCVSRWSARLQQPTTSWIQVRNSQNPKDSRVIQEHETRLLSSLNAGPLTQSRRFTHRLLRHSAAPSKLLLAGICWHGEPMPETSLRLIEIYWLVGRVAPLLRLPLRC